MKIPKARKLPSGTWFIQLRLGGESITVNARTEKEATRLAQMAKAEYLAGKQKKATEQPKPIPTLREACDEYIRSRVLSPSTERGYVKIKELRFQGIMDRNIGELKAEDYQKACKAEAARCSAKTLQNAWRFIGSVLRSQDITPPEVSLPQVVPHQAPFLDAEEIQIFLRAVKGHKYQIPMLLALSSLRRSEIMGLRWENVDLQHRRIRVQGSAVVDRNDKLVQKKENKNSSSTRYVPILMDELYEALKAAYQPSGLVVDCNPNTIWENIRKICKDHGLPPVGTHGLRHSFASLAYHLQVPEKYTMAIGGWKDDATMKKIYTHIAAADVKRYEDEFAGFFKNANKNANQEEEP